DNPAYMIYTSGSTGRPKGVLVPHRAVMNLLASMADEPGLRAGEKLVAVTTLSFDISVLELLLPLATGADLVIVDSETARDAFALRSILESSLATALQATPSTWQMLLEAGWHPPVGFRALIGGEALHPSLAHRLIASGAEVWNLYGPTETTVWSTCWKVENPQAGISIGRPIANTSIWVLDSHGLPCPIGVPGEICIGGTGVALGYWQRPELTAERFIPNRFADLAGARMYKTGDLGRWRYDGLLEHLGRLDNQVKVRGFRIELGEIESALLEQSDLKQAVVVTQVGNGADVSLVAYVVPARPVVDLGAMRERLRALLPFYMIPNVIVRLDHLPRLPNGKIDRNRLPAPTESDIREALPPTLKRPSLTEDEQAMAAIWTEFLGADGIGSADNFFDLGGNSLLATRVAVAIKRRMGRHIHPRRFIFENLGQLARREKEIA
nr:amino acid adenylation domain-containing protein [Pseudomonadota bacterium]